VGWDEKEIAGRFDGIQRQANPDEDTGGGYSILTEIDDHRQCRRKSPGAAMLRDFFCTLVTAE
jgi:hypothetical protein